MSDYKQAIMEHQMECHKDIDDKINKLNNNDNLFNQTIITMNKNIEDIKKLMKDGFEKIEKNFVTKTEMIPYKWLTGLILAGLIGAFVQKLSTLIY